MVLLLKMAYMTIHSNSEVSTKRVFQCEVTGLANPSE